MVDGKKICGILLEGAAAGPVVEWLVIGTGMNVKHHPPETRHPATDMTEAGVPVSLEDALSAYLMSFKRWWGRWRHVRSPLTAAELIDAGWSPGPGLGAELSRLRLQRIDQKGR